MTTNPQTAPLAADREQQIRDVVRDLRGWAGAPSTWTRMLHDVLAEVDRLRAVSVPAPAPTDQTALRDRIAEALHAQMPGCTHDGYGSDCRALADAVLAVLPANQTTDRAAWDALVRETGRLRLEAIELHDQAADIDARVAEFELRGTAEIRAAALTEAADFLRDAHFRDGLSVQEIGTAMRHWADRERAAAVSGPHDTDDATGQAEPRVVDWAEIDRRTAQSGIDTPGCDCGHDGMGASWHSKDCEWRSAPPCDHCGVRGHSVEDCPRDEQPAVVSQPDEEA